MSIKEAGIRVRAHRGWCRFCGHPDVVGATRPQGAGRLWIAYCPACLRVQEHADIPEWFWRDLPPAPDSRNVH